MTVWTSTTVLRKLTAILTTSFLRMRKLISNSLFPRYPFKYLSRHVNLNIQVTELGGVPILIKAGDMSNTIPDEKVTATFVGYLAARLLDLSREIKAARIIQVFDHGC